MAGECDALDEALYALGGSVPITDSEPDYPVRDDSTREANRHDFPLPE